MITQPINQLRLAITLEPQNNSKKRTIFNETESAPIARSSLITPQHISLYFTFIALNYLFIKYLHKSKEIYAVARRLAINLINWKRSRAGTKLMLEISQLRFNCIARLQMLQFNCILINGSDFFAAHLLEFRRVSLIWL